MDFEINAWNIEKLISLHEAGNLNLNPPYQRGDIWSLPAKKRLIDTIKLGFPLPTFFLYEKEINKFEMVDGQQRTRTILGYVKGNFDDLDGIKFDDSNRELFLNNYKLPIIIIRNVRNNEAIEDFYYRVNKFGTKLNRPEILKAQYNDTPIQKLVERIADSEKFEVLDLFAESSKSRMNDLDFIGELLTLIKYGITDKKIYVDKFYEDETFSEKNANELEIRFHGYLDHFLRFNKFYPIKHTRYRQRNDFYTLFGFVKENQHLTPQTLDIFFKIIVLIGPDISPSNEKCFAFQDYAINCVSQSNSKKAREGRLDFFEKLLLNTFPNPLAKKETGDENRILVDVMEYYNFSDSNLMHIQAYYTLDIEMLNKQKSGINFNNGTRK